MIYQTNEKRDNKLHYLNFSCDAAQGVTASLTQYVRLPVQYFCKKENIVKTVVSKVCKKNKVLENHKCTLISWTYGSSEGENSKGVNHFDLNLARSFVLNLHREK